MNLLVLSTVLLSVLSASAQRQQQLTQQLKPVNADVRDKLAQISSLQLSNSFSQQLSSEAKCQRSDVSFELVTGFVFTAPEFILDTLPGTLKLEDCVEFCFANETCMSVNYETGLCVLFSSSAEIHPGNLQVQC